MKFKGNGINVLLDGEYSCYKERTLYFRAGRPCIVFETGNCEDERNESRSYT